MKYLNGTLNNISPLRIADDSTSQQGQTLTLNYIPGSTIRGMVITQLSNFTEFENWKPYLFSNQICFENAYPMNDDQQLIPSPFGFYEDKTEEKDQGKKIENILIDGNVTPGNKRASLGQYASLKKNEIHYGSIEFGSDLKILSNLHNDKKRNIFRNQYIQKGYSFYFQIILKDTVPEKLIDAIKNIFDDQIIYLGNARSNGYGQCKVNKVELKDQPNFSIYSTNEDMSNECYMILLSNTTMRNDFGEICGLNLNELEQQMNVQELQVLYSSTTVETVRGYNRIWSAKIPAIPMYVKGSAFHLVYQGTLTVEKAHEMMIHGIGIRRNEGYGQVLFMTKAQYEAITIKKSKTIRQVAIESAHKMDKEERESIFATAKRYYQMVVDEKINKYVLDSDYSLYVGDVSKSQLGAIESIILANREDPIQGFKKIDEYLEHALEKENKQRVQSQYTNIETLKNTINEIERKSLKDLLQIRFKKSHYIMGIREQKLFGKSYEELEAKKKLELIVRMIRFANKKEDK